MVRGKVLAQADTFPFSCCVLEWRMTMSFAHFTLAQLHCGDCDAPLSIGGNKTVNDPYRDELDLTDEDKELLAGMKVGW
jgi:hypothetical protein